MFASLLAMLGSPTCCAATIWNGPSITFTKASFADTTLAENQDRLTDKVWLTRNNTAGIYNASVENFFDQPVQVIDSISPAGTAWAFGSGADYESLTFDTWIKTIEQRPAGPDNNMLDRPMVLHLIEDDIYLDIMFTDWGVGSGSGGNFTYVRSTPNPIPEPGAGLLAAGLLALHMVQSRLRLRRKLWE